MALPPSKNQIVLISGVNGYIAARTAEAFLKTGYHVRGTVRSMSSADGLLKALEVCGTSLLYITTKD
jgi:nucleoside-diphosphate-sugar epimerase